MELLGTEAVDVLGAPWVEDLCMPCAHPLSQHTKQQLCAHASAWLVLLRVACVQVLQTLSSGVTWATPGERTSASLLLSVLRGLSGAALLGAAFRPPLGGLIVLAAAAAALASCDSAESSERARLGTAAGISRVAREARWRLENRSGAREGRAAASSRFFCTAGARVVKAGWDSCVLLGCTARALACRVDGGADDSRLRLAPVHCLTSSRAMSLGTHTWPPCAHAWQNLAALHVPLQLVLDVEILLSRGAGSSMRTC